MKRYLLRRVLVTIVILSVLFIMTGSIVQASTPAAPVFKIGAKVAVGDGQLGAIQTEQQDADYWLKLKMKVQWNGLSNNDCEITSDCFPDCNQCPVVTPAEEEPVVEPVEEETPPDCDCPCPCDGDTPPADETTAPVDEATPPADNTGNNTPTMTDEQAAFIAALAFGDWAPVTQNGTEVYVRQAPCPNNNGIFYETANSNGQIWAEGYNWGLETMWGPVLVTTTGGYPPS